MNIAEEKYVKPKAFRVRYTIYTKPSNYKYQVVEERWIGGIEEFDCKEEFFLGAGTLKHITGFIPSYGPSGLYDVSRVRIMWIIMPPIYMQQYTSPLQWWLNEHKQSVPFSYEKLRYFAEPGESLFDQANRVHGRFRGYC